LRFACDIDCTAVALRARLVMGDVDPMTVDGAFVLKKSTDRILCSAAVGNVRPDTNRSHGKENGELRRHVFKVYLDDHEVQGAEYDRGLKNDAVVVLNALHCVLEELRHQLRSPEEIVQLKEYMEKRQEPRTGAATVAELVAANLAYVTQHLATGAWQAGTRYYPSPDVFLFCFADLLAKFPELSIALPGLELRLRQALQERTDTAVRGSLEVALTAIAGQMLGVSASRDLEILLATQRESGCWDDFCPLFRLGSRSPQIFFGSVAQNTAFAVRALSSAEQVRETDPAQRDYAWFHPIAERWVRALDVG
jgi:hypothetical protein